MTGFAVRHLPLVKSGKSTGDATDCSLSGRMGCLRLIADRLHEFVRRDVIGSAVSATGGGPGQPLPQRMLLPFVIGGRVLPRQLARSPDRTAGPSCCSPCSRRRTSLRFQNRLRAGAGITSHFRASVGSPVHVGRLQPAAGLCRGVHTSLSSGTEVPRRLKPG